MYFCDAGYCHTRSAVAKFRAEAVYIEFMKQWNIGVYFSLRYSVLKWLLSLEIVYPLSCHIRPWQTAQFFGARGWGGTSVISSENVRQTNCSQFDFNCFRFQEIAGTLDSSLTVASLVLVKSSSSDLENSQELLLKQSTSLLECLRSCWRDDVLVISCSDKFLRLTLQLLSRLVCLKS